MMTGAVPMVPTVRLTGFGTVASLVDCGSPPALVAGLRCSLMVARFVGSVPVPVPGRSQFFHNMQSRNRALVRNAYRVVPQLRAVDSPWTMPERSIGWML